MNCKSSLFLLIEEISAVFFSPHGLFFFFSPQFSGDYSYLRDLFLSGQ